MKKKGARIESVNEIFKAGERLTEAQGKGDWFTPGGKHQLSTGSLLQILPLKGKLTPTLNPGPPGAAPRPGVPWDEVSISGPFLVSSGQHPPRFSHLFQSWKINDQGKKKSSRKYKSVLSKERHLVNTKECQRWDEAVLTHAPSLLRRHLQQYGVKQKSLYTDLSKNHVN